MRATPLHVVIVLLALYFIMDHYLRNNVIEEHFYASQNASKSSQQQPIFTDVGYKNELYNLINVSILNEDLLALIDIGLRNNNPHIRLPFLQTYHNPCWNETLPYPESLYYNNMFDLYVKKHLKPHFYRLRQEYLQDWLNGLRWRVRCLPHFYVIGFPKCGTTDVFNRIINHPQVFRGNNKELHWWTKARNGLKPRGISMAINDYIEMFDDTARNFTHNCGNSSYKSCVTGEGSVSTVWLHSVVTDTNGTYSLPEAENTTAAGAIFRITPQAKIITMVRDPVSRVFSDYMFFTRRPEMGTFNELVVDSVNKFKACLEKYSLRICTLHPKVANYPVRIHLSIYHVALEDWFKLFGRQGVHLIKLEDYSKNIIGHMRQLYSFLGLDPITSKEEENIGAMKRANDNTKNKQKQEVMSQDVIELLTNFYKPYNTLLADYLEDPRFLWEDNS